MEPATKLDPTTELALRSLHDIAMPPPVSMFPQTWGWALVALFLTAVLCWQAFVMARRYRRNAYRREALRLLDDIAAELRNTSTPSRTLANLAELLKRTSLAVWQRDQVAALNGKEFFSFLQTSSNADSPMPTLLQLLDDLEYHDSKTTAAMVENNADQLVEEARHWIGGHRVPA